MKKHGIKCLRFLIAAQILLFIFFYLPTGALAAEQAEYSDYLWYSQLDTEGARLAYNRLVEAIEALEDEVYFPTSTGCTEADIRAAFDGISNDFPEYFYVLHFGVREAEDGSGCLANFYWGISYSYATKEEVIQARNEVKSKIDSFLSSLPANVQTDYDKALYTHDYLANTIDYKWVMNSQNIYGALVEGKCVCAGYANAYTVLMRQLGVKTWYIQGAANGGSHAWNVSWIDGDCVYTDITWDDLNPGVKYDYFNISGEEMGKDHILDSEYANALEPCVHTDHKYKADPQKEEPSETKPVIPKETLPVVTEPVKETVPAETTVPTTPSVSVPADPSETTPNANEPPATEPHKETTTNELTQATEPHEVENGGEETESSDNINGSFIATLLYRVCLSLVFAVLNGFGIHV